MHRVTNNLVPSRWEHTRLPSKTELTSTGILRVDVHSASAKIHGGGPSDERKDLRDESVTGSVWTGVVPTWLSYGPLLEVSLNLLLRSWVGFVGWQLCSNRCSGRFSFALL